MCATQSILQRRARVRCRGYVGILQRAREFPVNQGGTADNVYSSLTKLRFCQGLFCAHKHLESAYADKDRKEHSHEIHTIL